MRAAANGPPNPQSRRLTDAAAPTVARDQPNSLPSGSIARRASGGAQTRNGYIGRSDASNSLTERVAIAMA